VRQGRRQFKPAPAYIRGVVAQHTYRRISGHHRARLVDLLFIDQYATGKDIRPRPLAAGNKSPLNQQQIYAGFRSGRHSYRNPLAIKIKGSFPRWK
jgi:hypothetical protein